MKKKFDNLILLFLVVIFIFLFRYSVLVQGSVIESSKLWFKNLVPFMFSMYLIIDLLINYGLGVFLYKIFKRNYPFLIIVSFFLGSPSNAKYISDFYKSGYIDEQEGNWLLLFAYSPNPLFILGICPSIRDAVFILGYIYITNLLIGMFSKRYFKSQNLKSKCFDKCTFSKCIESSIYKAFNVLILILGIITIYGVLIDFIDILFPNNPVFLKVLLEMTNAINLCLALNENVLLWIMLASTFAGLSIHTQIKSILEDTNISYKYFLLGRLIASIPLLLLIIFN